MMMRTNMMSITRTTTGILIGAVVSSSSASSSSLWCDDGLSASSWGHSGLPAHEEQSRCRETESCALRNLDVTFGHLTQDMNECAVASEPQIRWWVEDLDFTAINICVCRFQSRHSHLHSTVCHLSPALHLEHTTGLLSIFPTHSFLPLFLLWLY